MRDPIRPIAGFTLVDLVVTIAFLAVVMGIAVPAVQDVTRAMRLGQAARDIERELQTARLKAVATNRTLRVRFNCPEAGQFRMVELIGTPGVPAAADGSTDRCREAAYPYPSDPNLEPPNHDGPVRRLQPTVTFNAVETVEFRPDGTAHVAVGGTNPWPDLAGTGTALVVQQSHGDVVKTKSITVNGLGRIQIH